MPRIESTVGQTVEPWRPDHKVIGKLRVKVFLVGVVSALLTATPLLALTGYLLLQTFRGAEALREQLGPDAAIDFAAFLKGRPDIISVAGCVVVMGAACGLFGVWLIKRTVGPQRRPHKVLLLTLTIFPIMCCAVPAVLAAFRAPAVGLLIGSIGIGWACWLVPVQLTLAAVGMLTIAKGSAWEEPEFTDSEELPAKALDYFEEIEPTMVELDLERIGDIAYPPTRAKCRRVWANPSRTVFVSTAYFPTNNGALQAVSAYSVTEGGKWFETSNLNMPLKMPEAYQHQFQIVPNASAEEVVRMQFEALQQQLREHGDRPMQITRDEQMQMTSYGSAYLSHAKREKTGTDILWLADPYLGLPLPPVPGRPWNPEEALDDVPRAPEPSTV